MKTRVDAQLLEQAARLRFRFACEDCAHFSDETQACSFGYHAAPRRHELEPRLSGSGPSDPSVVELCKTYELA
jgi:hypothetical protein